MVTKFGEATWHKVLSLSKAAPEGAEEFAPTQNYDEKLLYDVVAAICKVASLYSLRSSSSSSQETPFSIPCQFPCLSQVLNVSSETAMELAGRHFIAYAKKTVPTPPAPVEPAIFGPELCPCLLLTDRETATRPAARINGK